MQRLFRRKAEKKLVALVAVWKFWSMNHMRMDPVAKEDSIRTRFTILEVTYQVRKLQAFSVCPMLGAVVVLAWLRAILPSALRVEEEAWNAYPYTRTKYTCPFVERFVLDVETRYFNDAGFQPNVFNLTESELAERTIGKSNSCLTCMC